LPDFVLPEGFDTVRVIELVRLEKAKKQIIRVVFNGVVFLFFIDFSSECGDQFVLFWRETNAAVEKDSVGMAVLELHDVGLFGEEKESFVRNERVCLMVKSHYSF
jgi:hypothetical protein